MLSVSDLLRDSAFVNGYWVEADSGARYSITNPADGQLIASVPDMADGDARLAIEAAASAFTDWKSRLASDRASFLEKWHDLILENTEDLALLMTLEQGKPLKEARGEVVYAASFVKWFAEEARRSNGEVIPSHAKGHRIMTFREPVGVVAAITPWNFPSAMITRKVAPALAVGCTVVAKPSDLTPLSALALARLAEEAGFPPGVFNVVTASDPTSVGKEMMANTAVRKISFTGSTRVGKLLLEGSADTVKRVSLELGGNAPFIVFDDADLNMAVEGALASKYRNAGQTCVCANRLFVQEGVLEAFTELFVSRVKSLRVGPGEDPESEIGPLINEAAVDKVERLLNDAREKGATLWTGGERHALGHTYFNPTVVSDVTDEMAISKEEIFGPVAGITSFATEDEVIKRANDTPFGLAAYFYTKDSARIWRVSEGLEYGMIGVNTGMLSTPVAPFGGVKESGLGREGSTHGTDEFLETKYVCQGGI